MKIAFIGTRGIPSRYGGTETYIEYLSKYLAKKNDTVLVYCQKSSQTDMDIQEVKNYPSNIKRVEIISIPSKHLDNLIRSFFSTLHVCLNRKIEIVQFNNAGPCLFSFIPRLFGKKVVGAMRALDYKREKWDMFTSGLLRLGQTFSIFFAHITTVNSLEMERYFYSRYKYKSIYIPNGIVLPSKKFIPNKIKKWGLQKKNYILFMARLEPEKGCHILIEAFKQIQDKAKGLKLIIAGHRGYSQKYYEKLINNDTDRIHFTGFVSGLAKEELFSNAFAFVLPSSVEGMSNSLLTAMSYGLPSIVSDIPENTALIDTAPYNNRINDYPGLCFKLWDVNDLASNLNILITNPINAELRGKLLREHINRHFKLEQMVKKTRQEYSKLLSHSRIW